MRQYGDHQPFEHSERRWRKSNRAKIKNAGITPKLALGIERGSTMANDKTFLVKLTHWGYKTLVLFHDVRTAIHSKWFNAISRCWLHHDRYWRSATIERQSSLTAYWNCKFRGTVVQQPSATTLQAMTILMLSFQQPDTIRLSKLKMFRSWTKEEDWRSGKSMEGTIIIVLNPSAAYIMFEICHILA